MKPIISILGTIAAIALFPHIAQASAYKTSGGSTFIHIKELSGGTVAIGTGYYFTSVGGTQWKGNFQPTNVIGSPSIITYIGTFTDFRMGPGAPQQCKGNLTLQRPVSNSGPAPLTATWTITPGGVNCPSPVGSMFMFNLTEAVPVANSSGNFLASNANTIRSETAGNATWPKWVVTDPTGLNCRNPAPSGTVLTTFPNASTIDVGYLGLNSFITPGGASWLRVPSQNCFIRANTQYIKPKLMPF